MTAKGLTGKRLRFILLAVLAGGLVLLAVLGPYIAPQDPLLGDAAASLQPPSWEHLCGTDKLGRDVFSRILAGAGSSFFLTFLMVLLAALIGTAVGLLAGCSGGFTDSLLSRVTDVFLAFPSSVFAIAVAGILGAGVLNTVFALGLVWWTRYARLTRTAAMQLRERDFIWQARFGGAGEWRILLRYILPEVIPQVVTTVSLDIGNMMMALAGLSFLGLAAQPPAPEWGYMLYESRTYMQTAPWMMLFPGLALLITVIVFNLLGDSVRDMLDPSCR